MTSSGNPFSMSIALRVHILPVSDSMIINVYIISNPTSHILEGEAREAAKVIDITFSQETSPKVHPD